MDEGAGENYVPQRTINPVINKPEVDVIRDALSLDLDDDTFLKYAGTLKREADDFWSEKGERGYNLPKRREDNEKMLFGRQYQQVKKKKYQSGAQDNILWESEAYLKAMATSKMPDITVTPGDDSEEKKKISKMLSKVLTSDIQSRERKRILGLAFKHNPVYFTGIIKPFWNPQKGKYGDRDAKVVHPMNVTVDFRATSNDTKDMDFIFEVVEETVKEICMKFPNKEEKFFDELRKWNVFGDAGDPDVKSESNEAGMNTKVKYVECWFKWYKKPEGEKKEWETIIGVAWYFNGVLFKKMRHPYWDWQGKPQTFVYTVDEVKGEKDTYKQNKKPASSDMLKQMVSSGQPMDDTETQTVFHNHMDYPEFPYIFLGMDQWGKTPLDETTRIEQTSSIQMQYDKRNQQLDEIIDRSRPKGIFSSSEGITKDDVANIDLSDPYQKALIRGDVSKVFTNIPGEQPAPAIFQNIQDSRERIFDKLGVHQATRGQINSETAATNNQIAREGDFSRMDDLVDDTINYACEKWANWDMQFIKLFYTEPHFTRLLGPDGKWLTGMIHRDDVADGMQAVISASGSDKLKAEQRAIDNAKMKLIDPYRYYVDTGESDPRGRTQSLMTFLMNPQAYLMDIQNGGDGSSMGNGVQQAAQTVNGQVVDGGQQTQQPDGQQSPGQSGGDPQALQDIMQIEQGQIPPTPQQISPGYMQTFTAFMQSQEPEQLIAKFGDQFKAQLLQFAQQVAELSKNMQQGPQQQQPGQPHPAVAQVGGAQNQQAGPLVQQPSPNNTTRVAANAPRPGL